MQRLLSRPTIRRLSFAILCVVVQLSDSTLLSQERDIQSVYANIESRRLKFIERENQAWSRVDSAEGWERMRETRLTRLAQSLGQARRVQKQFSLDGTLMTGDGYSVRNVLFESIIGLHVTANLYRPLQARLKGPGVLISHSHHSPKTQGELQDIGMTLARQGCCVLVMDMLGHGERRQHHFVTADDYPASQFRVGRQDYYFRYDVGIQLHLVGESLMGWMVQDLRRGVDLLLSLEEVDPDSIIMLGSVAGGGDPAAVTAALDNRIAVVAPFNFGGPQPDYRTPEDPENRFYFFGVPYWESTRALRGGAPGGFAQWLIVAAVAPRGLIYSHEFSWDEAADPVWPRIQHVYSLYGGEPQLGTATGRGSLQGPSSEATHCNNIGPVHRSQVYAHLRRWLNFPWPVSEYRQRRSADELRVLNDSQSILSAGAVARIHANATRMDATERVDKSSARKRRLHLVKQLEPLLGSFRSSTPAKMLARNKFNANGPFAEELIIETEPGIPISIIGLFPENPNGRMVVMLSRQGGRELLKQRRPLIDKLLEAGNRIHLVDVRCTGRTAPSSWQGPGSEETNVSCKMQLVGETLLGLQLHDLMVAIQFLRGRGYKPVVVWGESLEPANDNGLPRVVPHRATDPNVQGDAAAGLLAVLCGIFDPSIEGIVANGSVGSWSSLLDSPRVYVSHGAVLPGLLNVAEAEDLLSALAPRPVSIGRTIDGQNRLMEKDEVEFGLDLLIRNAHGRPSRDHISIQGRETDHVPDWLLQGP